MWDKTKPIATVIMLNPCESDGIITDTTTSLVLNNVARLESFGAVTIVNLYSMLTSKLNFKWNSDADLNHEDNAILGKWIRDKIGAADGEFVTKEMLEQYGATGVVFKKYKNNIYVLEFEPNGS